MNFLLFFKYFKRILKRIFVDFFQIALNGKGTDNFGNKIVAQFGKSIVEHFDTICRNELGEDHELEKMAILRNANVTSVCDKDNSLGDCTIQTYRSNGRSKLALPVNQVLQLLDVQLTFFQCLVSLDDPVTSESFSGRDTLLGVYH